MTETTIHFSEDMPFTDSEWVRADDVHKKNDMLTFTLGKGDYWEKEVSVPIQKVQYIERR